MRVLYVSLKPKLISLIEKGELKEIQLVINQLWTKRLIEDGDFVNYEIVVISQSHSSENKKVAYQVKSIYADERMTRYEPKHMEQHFIVELGDKYIGGVESYEKVCSTCHRLLPASEFFFNTNTSDNCSCSCKECYAVETSVGSDNVVEDLQGEIWKDVVGYEEYAEVSNLGRVLIKERLFDNGVNKCYKPMRLATISKNKHGYATITLHVKGKTVRLLVHRLVAQAFIPNTHNLPCVNHKDENKVNNCVYNLEWCDREYNNNYGTRNERISIANKGKFTIKMKKHLDNVKENMKTPIAQFDKNGCFIQAFESISEAERALGVRIAYIFHRGKTGAKGFIFKRISKPAFLALAALREDSDYMQFFTNGNHWYLCEANRIENSSLFDKEYKLQIKEGCDYHKATAEEIIEHFKD